MDSRASAGGEPWILVPVTGMSCRHDARAVSRALTDVKGVVALQVDMTTGTVRIEGAVSPRAVRQAIEAAGYSVA